MPTLIGPDSAGQILQLQPEHAGPVASHINHHLLVRRVPPSPQCRTPHRRPTRRFRCSRQPGQNKSTSTSTSTTVPGLPAPASQHFGDICPPPRPSQATRRVRVDLCLRLAITAPLACCLASLHRHACPLSTVRRPPGHSLPPSSFPFGARLSAVFLACQEDLQSPAASTPTASHELGPTAGIPDLHPGISAAGLPFPPWRAGCDVVCANLIAVECAPLPNSNAPAARGQIVDASGRRRSSNLRSERRQTLHLARLVFWRPPQRNGSDQGAIPRLICNTQDYRAQNLGDSPGTGVVCEIAVTLTHFRSDSVLNESPLIIVLTARVMPLQVCTTPLKLLLSGGQSSNTRRSSRSLPPNLPWFAAISSIIPTASCAVSGPASAPAIGAREGPSEMAGHVSNICSPACIVGPEILKSNSTSSRASRRLR